MPDEEPKGSRRPLKSRTTPWAAALTNRLLKTGISPNQISFAGVVVSLVGAWSIIAAPAMPLLFLAGAAAIQLRLLANLLDGLVAVEGGRGGPTGGIWNEFPDRIEDSLFLVAAGYAATLPWLGWLAALLAAICAYVRLLGGTLGRPQDFSGPMAKQHRMAALTLACLAATVWLPALAITLGLVAAGTALTIGRRLARLSRALRA